MIRIVKPTEPPSMAVVVETVVNGVIILRIAPADRRYNRIDAIFGGNGSLRIVTGAPGYQPMPPRLDNMRLIATIWIPRDIADIRHHQITEMI